MKIRCDLCGKSVKKVGKLLKVKFLTLCKKCRAKLKKSEE
jgi:ribosome-binding protein aMBF1 (putative translation factor)